MDVYEDLLGSKRAVRVLGIVSEFGELTISELVRKAGIDHVVGDMVVKQLAGVGLLFDDYIGKNRLIRPSFKSFQIRFIKNQGIETQLTN